MIRASFGKTAAGRLLLGAGVLALLIPAVAGCEAGNDAPTLQYHAAAFGANTTFNGIQITNAFVLGAPSGSTVPAGSSASLFVSLYNRGNSSDTLQSISAPGWAGSITLSGNAVSGGTVPLPASSQPVNLTGPEPEAVLESLTKPLRGGSTLPVKFNFEHAGSVTLQVPIEAQDFQWATFSPPASGQTGGAAISTSTATPIATPTAARTATGNATPTTTHGTPTATPTATP